MHCLIGNNGVASPKEGGCVTYGQEKSQIVFYGREINVFPRVRTCTTGILVMGAPPSEGCDVTWFILIKPLAAPSVTFTPAPP